MRVLKYGGIAVAGALIVLLSSLTQFVCSTWLSMSEPLVQTMVLTALSLCGSGFAALMEPRCNASFAMRRKIPTLLQYSPHCVSYKNALLPCVSFHQGRRRDTMDSALPVNKRLDYRQEAQSIRAIASEMKNPKIQEQLLLIGSLYDKLADIAEHAGHAVPPWAAGRRTGKN
jgi:hypothetical protein